jgi:hypothetical protein
MVLPQVAFDFQKKQGFLSLDITSLLLFVMELEYVLSEVGPEF